MTASDIENVKAYVHDKFQSLPRIEEKLESTNNKITYLVKKVNQLSKAQGTSSSQSLTSERLKGIAEKLRDIGLVIEYTDGRGYMKLKALDQRGIDNLKRMNTLFPASMVESYLENFG
jgi:hypothetical protein